MFLHRHLYQLPTNSQSTTICHTTNQQPISTNLNEQQELHNSELPCYTSSCGISEFQPKLFPYQKFASTSTVNQQGLF